MQLSATANALLLNLSVLTDFNNIFFETLVVPLTKGNTSSVQNNQQR